MKPPLFGNDDVIDDVMARFLKLKNDICFSLYLNEYECYDVHTWASDR